MNTVQIKKDGELVAQAWNANRYFSRLRGLVGREIPEGGGLLLTPCNSIHMIGMKYSIDAVYLDRKGSVLRIDRALPVGKICKPERGAKRVLELPAGYAMKRGIRTGDLLEVSS